VRELEHLISRAALRALAEPRRGARWIAIEPRHLGLDSGAGRLAHGTEEIAPHGRAAPVQQNDGPAPRFEPSPPASAPRAGPLPAGGTLR
ncbi:hypothetical protein O6467_24705, partial [Salmonella enterica subsp. enterica]